MKTLVFLYILAGFHSDVKLMPDETTCRAAIVALDRGDKAHGNQEDNTKADCYAVNTTDMKAEEIVSDTELEKQIKRIIQDQKSLLSEEKEVSVDPAKALRLQQHLNDVQKVKP
jgi:hypothetical protein